MLETCGVFFNRGAAGKKLDYFLSFFQVRWLQIYKNNMRANNDIVLHPHEDFTPHGY